MLVMRMTELATGFAEDGRRRVSDVFGAVMVAAAEEQHRRRSVVEQVRRELDDGDAGSLLSDWADRPRDLDDI
jgi:hypothetical protein